MTTGAPTRTALLAAALLAAAGPAEAGRAPAAVYPSLGAGVYQAQRLQEPARWPSERREHRVAEVRLPASFFDGDGGVGPSFVSAGYDSRWVTSASGEARVGAQVRAGGFRGCGCRR